MSSIPATAPADGALTHKQILTILAGLMVGMFLAALDQTIVSTAIRTIADDLHGLSAAGLGHHRVPDHLDDHDAAVRQAVRHLRPQAAVPHRDHDLHRRLAAVHVRPPRCTSSPRSAPSRASARAVCSRWRWRSWATSSPPRERARYQGYFLAVFGISSVLGPLIGGFFAGPASILGIAGWRWVFLVNVPIGIVALLRRRRDPAPPARRGASHRIDWWGAAALIVGAGAAAASSPSRAAMWGWDVAASRSPATLIGALGLVAFVYVERRMGDDALIPLRLFRSRMFSIGSRPVGSHRHGHVRRDGSRCRCTCRSSRARPRPSPGC